MGIEGSRSAEAPEAPDIAQELVLANHALRLAGEREEQLVLLRREGNRPAADADRPRRAIDLKLADFDAVAPSGAVCAAQDRMHPRQQLLVDERLHEVVVAS